MGSISGRKLNQVIDNLEYIQAIELLYATQAIDFRRPLRSTPVIEACHKLIREYVPFIKDDRIFSVDINQIHQLIISGKFLATANQTAANHNINLNDDDEFGIY